MENLSFPRGTINQGLYQENFTGRAKCVKRAKFALCHVATRRVLFLPIKNQLVFFLKRALFQGQKEPDWWGKPEGWRSICPTTMYVKKGPDM